MFTLKNLLIFVFTLSMIGCDGGLFSPIEKESTQVESILIPADTTDIIMNSRGDGTQPLVLISNTSFNKIRRFSWTNLKFSTLYTNSAKSLAYGTHKWRNSPFSNKSYVRKNHEWKRRNGLEGGALDMCAVKIPTVTGSWVQACFAISNFTNQLYVSNGYGHFQMVSGLENERFKRVDAISRIDYETELFLIGYDNKIWHVRIDKNFVCYQSYKSNQQHDLIDIAFSNPLTITKLFAINSSGSLVCSNNLDNWVNASPSISNARHLDSDRDNNIWVVKNNNSVWVYTHGPSFTKIGDNLAWDIATERDLK